jgi:hypothetical protein
MHNSIRSASEMAEMVGNWEADLVEANGASEAPHGTHTDI